MQLEIFVSGLGHLLSWLEIPVPRQETAVSLCGNCRISTWKLAFLYVETEFVCVQNRIIKGVADKHLQRYLQQYLQRCNRLIASKI